MQDSTKTRIEAVKADPNMLAISFPNEGFGKEGALLLAQVLQDRKCTSFDLTNCSLDLDALQVLLPVMHHLTPDKITFVNNKITVDEFNREFLAYKNAQELFKLIEENSKVKVTEYIKQHPGILSTPNGSFALHYAKQREMVDLLITQGANIHVINTKGNTPLQQALIDESPIFLRLARETSVEELRSLEKSVPQSKIIDWLHLIIENRELKQNLVETKNEINTIKSKMTQEFELLRKELAEANAKIKTGDQFFNDLVIKGATTGNEKLIDTGIGAGAKIDTLNESGETALYLSLKNDHFETTNFLLKTQPTLIKKPNQQGKTPLEQLASDDQSVTKTEWLIAAAKEKCPDFNMDKEFDHLYQLAAPETKKLLALDKLWTSVKTGNLAGVKQILDKNELKFDINDIRFQKTDETLLYQAVYYLYEDIVCYLLSKGADIRIKNHVGKTNGDHHAPQDAYELAISLRTKKNMMKIMVGHMILDICTNTENTGELKKVLNDAKGLLLAEWQDVLTKKDSDGNICLHISADNADLLKIILDSFENNPSILETTNNADKTALHIAVEKNCLESVKLLLEKGANVSAEDSIGQLPLHKAVINKNRAIVNLLLLKHAETGASINVRDENDQTPHALANAKDEDFAIDLVQTYGEYKANVRNLQGTTSLAASSIISSQSFFQKKEDNNKSNEKSAEKTKEEVCEKADEKSCSSKGVVKVYSPVKQ